MEGGIFFGYFQHLLFRKLGLHAYISTGLCGKINRPLMEASAIIPSLTYKDAAKAIDWLQEAFGFQHHLIVPGENGNIMHAELRLDNVMIMIGSAQSGTEFSKRTKPPSEVGGFETQSPYIVVDDPDAIYERAMKKGAKIAVDIKTEDYGGRGFSCYDPEGHLWSFGSYDPWDVKPK